MISSTSNSKLARAMRAMPKGLIGAIVLIIIGELFIDRTHLWFADEATAMWQEKVRIAESEPHSVDIIVLGSSRFMHGLMPNEMINRLTSPATAYSYALSGMHPMGFLALLERHLAHHAPPKTVVIEYSPNHFNYDMESTYASPYLTVLYNGDDLWRSLHWDPDATIAAEWMTYRLSPTARYRLGLDHFISRTLTERRRPTASHDRNLAIQRQFAELNGYRPWKTDALPDDWLNHVRNAPSPEAFSPKPAMTDALNKILALCQQHDVACAIVPAPLPNESVQRRRATGYEAAFMNWLNDTVARFDDVTVLPVVGMEHRYFCDPTHLNPLGATVFSRHLGDALNRHAAQLGLADKARDPRIAKSR